MFGIVQKSQHPTSPDLRSEATQDVSRDDHPLDLVGFFIEGGGTNIPGVAFHGEFLDIAVSAKHLDRVIADPLCRFGCLVLCHGRLSRKWSALFSMVGRIHEKKPRRIGVQLFPSPPIDPPGRVTPKKIA